MGLHNARALPQPYQFDAPTTCNAYTVVEGRLNVVNEINACADDSAVILLAEFYVEHFTFL